MRRYKAELSILDKRLCKRYTLRKQLGNRCIQSMILQRHHLEWSKIEGRLRERYTLLRNYARTFGSFAGENVYFHDLPVYGLHACKAPLLARTYHVPCHFRMLLSVYSPESLAEVELQQAAVREVGDADVQSFVVRAEGDARHFSKQIDLHPGPFILRDQRHLLLWPILFVIAYR